MAGVARCSWRHNTPWIKGHPASQSGCCLCWLVLKEGVAPFVLVRVGLLHKQLHFQAWSCSHSQARPCFPWPTLVMLLGRPALFTGAPLLFYDLIPSLLKTLKPYWWKKLMIIFRWCMLICCYCPFVMCASACVCIVNHPISATKTLQITAQFL